MAQFFNFEEDYFGLTDSEIEKKIALYGFNTYTKEGKEAENRIFSLKTFLYIHTLPPFL